MIDWPWMIDKTLDPKMRWTTSAEAYGDFADSWRRIYLPQLPVRRRAEHLERLRQSFETSAAEYGAFYEKQQNDNDTEYTINRSFYLPPINRRTIALPDRPPARREKKWSRDEPRDPLTLKLGDIRDLNIEIKTYGDQSVNVMPKNSQGFTYKSNPPDLDYIRLPDIQNVNITLTKADGSLFNLPTKVQLYS